VHHRQKRVINLDSGKVFVGDLDGDGEVHVHAATDDFMLVGAHIHRFVGANDEVVSNGGEQLDFDRPRYQKERQNATRHSTSQQCSKPAQR